MKTCDECIKDTLGFAIAKLDEIILDLQPISNQERKTSKLIASCN